MYFVDELGVDFDDVSRVQDFDRLIYVFAVL